MKSTHLFIQNPQQVLELVEHLKKESKIAIDTEFIRERTFYPQLALIQIATLDSAWLIDPLSLNFEQLKPLLELLQSPDILKILHSSYADQECFQTAYQMTLKPTFDTFEAAALLGFGESVSLQELLQRVLGVKIPKFLTRTDWLQRPISEEMQQYAIADVAHLVALGEKMQKNLVDLQRADWAVALSQNYENPKLYEDNSEEIARRLAQSGRLNRPNFFVFQRLIAWREKRAKALDIPRRRVADDDVLINIANSRPQSLLELGKFRGIHPGEMRQQGETLLDLLHRPISPEESSLPKLHIPLKPTPEQTSAIDFLNTFLKSLCKKLKIALRLTLGTKALQRIVVDNITDPDAWVKAGLCSEAAVKIIGEEMKAALEGKRALLLKNNKLEIIHNVNSL